MKSMSMTTAPLFIASTSTPTSTRQKYRERNLTQWRRCSRPALINERKKNMKTIHTSIKTTLLVLIAMSFTAVFARADTYSWTNFQSDIAGVAQHVDPNLVNPWGMAASPSGTIWVSDNGTGVSTLYHQDGTAASLIVTIPPSAKNKGGGNPTGIVFNGSSFFNVT